MKSFNIKYTYKYLLLILALLSTALLRPAFAIDTPRPPENEGDELLADPSHSLNPKKQKYLPLYIGNEASETLPYLPPGAEFRGDFKKVTKVSVDRQTGTLLFTPTKEGFATLIVYNKRREKLYEFRLDVKKSSLSKVAREMRSLLSDVDGITIRIVNNKVVVDGQILLPRDMNRIHSVVKQYDGLASTIVTLSPLAQRRIASLIEGEIASPDITVRAVNDKFLLEGQANSDEERKRYFAIAQMYVPDVVLEEAVKDGVVQKIKREFVVNLITLKPGAPPEPEKIIQLVVHFVELNKNYQKGFNFQWMPTIEDKTKIGVTGADKDSGSGILNSITGTVSNLLPKLNWAKAYGHARVLQSSTLQVLNRQSGNLRSTVKVPYQVINNFGQPGTNFEETGIVMNITPEIINSRSDTIQLKMDFSVKSLLGLTDQGPMVSNSSLQTILTVRSGVAAAIGGLITNTTGTDYNKLPKSASETPLFSLYASKSFQRNQSQFIVFVTPIIKTNASVGASKIMRKFRVRE